MLGYLPTEIICSKKQKLLTSGTDTVQGQISEQIKSNGGYWVYYLSNMFLKWDLKKVGENHSDIA